MIERMRDRIGKDDGADDDDDAGDDDYRQHSGLDRIELVGIGLHDPFIAAIFERKLAAARDGNGGAARVEAQHRAFLKMDRRDGLPGCFHRIARMVGDAIEQILAAPGGADERGRVIRVAAQDGLRGVLT